MKPTFLLISLFLAIVTGQAQDILYQINGSIISCTVKEIKLDVITYTRQVIKKSPIYEVKKSDVYKIVYKNGLEDIFNPEFNNTVKNHRSKSDSARIKNDTSGYSRIYVVYNSGFSEQNFPLYIGGQYICTMKNQSRLEYKMISEGEIDVFRKINNKIGPIEKLVVKQGNTYAISIKMVNEQKFDPCQRFSLVIMEDKDEVLGFLKKEYSGFTPFKALDLHVVEKK